MKLTRLGLFAMTGVVGAFSALTLSGSLSRASEDAPAEKPAAPLSVAEARERAKLLHEVHSATLEALHRHYFKRDHPVLPARAMEDVFADVDKQTRIKTRWIAVNTPAMSVDHKPRSDFEKDAAAELAGGKSAFERVEKGVYHRAAVIPLGPGCVGCHTRFGAPPAKTPRVAGLIIAIPVKGK